MEAEVALPIGQRCGSQLCVHFLEKRRRLDVQNLERRHLAGGEISTPVEIRRHRAELGHLHFVGNFVRIALLHPRQRGLGQASFDAHHGRRLFLRGSSGDRPAARTSSARAASSDRGSLSIWGRPWCSSRDREVPGHPGDSLRSSRRSCPDPAASRYRTTWSRLPYAGEPPGEPISRTFLDSLDLDQSPARWAWRRGFRPPSRPCRQRSSRQSSG